MRLAAVWFKKDKSASFGFADATATLEHFGVVFQRKTLPAAAAG